MKANKPKGDSSAQQLRYTHLSTLLQPSVYWWVQYQFLYQVKPLFPLDTACVLAEESLFVYLCLFDIGAV